MFVCIEEDNRYNVNVILEGEFIGWLLLEIGG